MLKMSKVERDLQVLVEKVSREGVNNLNLVVVSEELYDNNNFSKKMVLDVTNCRVKAVTAVLDSMEEEEGEVYDNVILYFSVFEVDLKGMRMNESERVSGKYKEVLRKCQKMLILGGCLICIDNFNMEKGPSEISSAMQNLYSFQGKLQKLGFKIIPPQKYAGAGSRMKHQHGDRFENFQLEAIKTSQNHANLNSEVRLRDGNGFRLRAGTVVFRYKGVNNKKPVDNVDVLLLERRSWGYGFAGGGIEENETEPEAAVRELFEEAGVQIHEIDNTSKVNPYQFEFVGVIEDAVKRYKTYLFACVFNMSYDCDKDVNNYFKDDYPEKDRKRVWKPLMEARDLVKGNNVAEDMLKLSEKVLKS